MRTSRPKRRRHRRPILRPRPPRLRWLRRKLSPPSTSRACRPSTRSAPVRTFERFWRPVCPRICRARRFAERGQPIPRSATSSACPRIRGTSTRPATCRGLGRYRLKRLVGFWEQRREREIRRPRASRPSFRGAKDLKWLARQRQPSFVLGIGPEMTLGPLGRPASPRIHPALVTLQCSKASIRAKGAHYCPSAVTAGPCRNESHFIA